MGYREEFCDIWRREVTRPGADKLLEWLSTTDFFKAPASTRFHGACEEGLVMHSLNVYHALMDRFFEEGDNPESMAVCGLLHDLCKANYYKTGSRNESVVFSMQTFVVKLASAVSVLIAGIGIDLIGLDDTAAVQSESTLLGLRLLMVGLPVLGLVFSILYFMKKYRLTEAETARISEALRQREGSKG